MFHVDFKPMTLKKRQVDFLKMLETKENLCEIFGNWKNTLILNQIRNYLNRSRTNIFRKCPYPPVSIVQYLMLLIILYVYS